MITIIHLLVGNIGVELFGRFSFSDVNVVFIFTALSKSCDIRTNVMTWLNRAESNSIMKKHNEKKGYAGLYEGMKFVVLSGVPVFLAQFFSISQLNWEPTLLQVLELKLVN